jgi:hypothetical protein
VDGKGDGKGRSQHTAKSSSMHEEHVRCRYGLPTSPSIHIHGLVNPPPHFWLFPPSYRS